MLDLAGKINRESKRVLEECLVAEGVAGSASRDAMRAHEQDLTRQGAALQAEVLAECVVGRWLYKNPKAFSHPLDRLQRYWQITEVHVFDGEPLRIEAQSLVRFGTNAPRQRVVQAFDGPLGIATLVLGYQFLTPEEAQAAELPPDYNDELEPIQRFACGCTRVLDSGAVQPCCDHRLLLESNWKPPERSSGKQELT